LNQKSPSFSPLAAAPELARLQKQIQRSAQTVNLDGSFELGWGLSMICLGSGPYFNLFLPRLIQISPWLSWFNFLPFLGAALGPYAITKLIKRCVTWPRTGYVATPGEITLRQLILLIFYSLVLGTTLALPFVLGMEIYATHQRPELSDVTSRIVWHSIELVVGLAVLIGLRHKVVRPRPVMPTAYDAAIINQQLMQTPTGRQVVRSIKYGLPAMFGGAVLVLGGLAYALFRWHRAPAYLEASWPELAVLGFLVGMNALLYLMGNGATIGQYRWKWLVLVVLLLAPAAVAPWIPNPPAVPISISLLQHVPPVMLTVGFVWCLSGITTLAVFIWRHPLLPPEVA
jgi:hypothetical protein